MYWNLFDYSNYLSELIGFMLAIVSWKYLVKPFRLLAIQIFVGTFFDWGSAFIAVNYFHFFSPWIYRCYILIAVSIVLLAAREMIHHIVIRKVLLITNFTFLVLSLGLLICDFSLNLGERIYIVGSLLIGISYFYVLYENYYSNKVDEQTRNFIFWLSIVQIMYYLGQVPSLAAYNNKSTTQEFMKLMSNINGILNTFLYLVTGCIFFFIRKQNLKSN